MKNNKIIIPKSLKRGDTIGVLAISGEVFDEKKLEHAIKYFEEKGFKMKLSKNIHKKNNYLAGSDNERAEALNEFFADPEIDAIVCARGGYGAIRLFDKIDWAIIKNNPKIFTGYSDVTAMNLMIYKKTGLVTYCGAMAIPDFGSEINFYTEKSFFNILGGHVNQVLIDEKHVLNKGKAQGILWGGNLATIQSLCGLDFVPDEKFIFLIEDVNEPVYKIDKMITQLFNINKFKQNLAGFVLGDFSGLDRIDWFNEFFIKLTNNLNIPAVSGLKFGHEIEKQTIPIGINVILDTSVDVIKFVNDKKNTAI